MDFFVGAICESRPQIQSGIGVPKSRNQRYECHWAFPGYECHLGIPRLQKSLMHKFTPMGIGIMIPKPLIRVIREICVIRGSDKENFAYQILNSHISYKFKNKLKKT